MDSTEADRDRAPFSVSDALFEQRAVGIAEIDSQTGQFLRLNARYAEIAGYSIAEMEQLTFQAITNPEDLAEDLANMERLRTGETTGFTMEKRYHAKNGATVWVNLTVWPLWRPGESPSRHIAIVEDITPRKTAEEGLRRQEERYRRLTALLPVGVYETNASGDCTYVNPAWLAMAGMTPEEPLGSGWLEGIHPEDRAGVGNAWRQMVEARGAWGHEYRFRSRAGKVTWVYGVAAPFTEPEGRGRGYIGVNADITERKQAELERARVQQLIDAAFGAVDIGIVIVSVRESGDFVYEGMNPAHERLVGARAEQVVGKRPEDLVPLFGQTAMGNARRVYDRCVRDRDVVESEFYVPDGPAKGWWFSRIVPIIDSTSGRVVRLVGSGMLITELKTAQEALQRSEARLKAIFDSVPDHLILLDENEVVKLVNRIESALVPEDVVGKPLAEVLEPSSRELVMHCVEQVARTGATQRFQLSRVMPDGTTRHFSSIVVPLRVGSTTSGSVISSRDVTAQVEVERRQRELEAASLQSQKMEAIGTLAGGVAHDMNNVLAGIMLGAGVLRETLDADPATREDLAQIVKACERGRDLTANLLGFARKGKYAEQALALSGVVSDIAQLLERAIPKTVEIEVDVPASLPPIQADASQFSVALMNLCNNALDAMSGRGTLTLRGRVGHLDEEGGEPPSGPPGVLLSVTDTGEGMSTETIQRAIEPFFTTKPPGSGTGLGLSMVYGTVTNHGGKLQIQSQPGQGTTVHLWLPAHPEATLAEEARDLAPASSAVGTILVAEDDDVVSTVTRGILERAGHRVLHARDGAEALLVFTRLRSEIDLVLLDLVMPRMDGMEAFSELRKLAPHLPILITSGYGTEEKVQRLITAGAAGFLRKPYSVEDLQREVSAALTGG